MILHYSRVALPEDAPLTEITAFFADHGFEVVVHHDPPPEPSAEALRRMSSPERRSKRDYAVCAGLRSTSGSVLVRWYGGGDSEEAAVRSARARWRVEQEGPEADQGNQG